MKKSKFHTPRTIFFFTQIIANFKEEVFPNPGGHNSVLTSQITLPVVTNRLSGNPMPRDKENEKFNKLLSEKRKKVLSKLEGEEEFNKHN